MEELTGHGWDLCLHTLTGYLEHFRGRAVTYVEAEAPPESAHDRAWPVLGRCSWPLWGPRPRWRPETRSGSPPRGWLRSRASDYMSPTCLGVRRSGALYRVHGRASIGMLIAAGHHLSTETVDLERTAGAWRSWLAWVFAGAPAPRSPG